MTACKEVIDAGGPRVMLCKSYSCAAPPYPNKSPCAKVGELRGAKVELAVDDLR
jgi:hypothetical protein